MATKKKRASAKKFDAPTEIRSIARERIGTVKPGHVIVPKSERKPKYKTDPLIEPES